MGFELAIYWGFLLACLAAICYIAWRTRAFRGKFDEFMVGGRRIGGVIIALNALAATASAVTMQSGTGICYLFGLPIAVAFAVPHVLFYPLAVFLGTRVSAVGSRLNAYTIPEYFNKRFESKFWQGWLGILTGVLLFIYISQVYILEALLFSVYLKVSFIVGIVLAVIITIVYTMISGARSTILGNALMGALLVIAIAGLIGTVLYFKPLGTLLEELFNSPAGPYTFGLKSKIPYHLIWNIVLPLGMIPVAMPHVLQSLLAMKKEPVERIKSSATMLVCVSIVYFLGFFFAALLTHPQLLGTSFWKPHPELPGKPSDWAIPYYFAHFTHPVLAAIFLCGVVAAAISTAGAGALTSSFGLVHDFVKVLFKPTMSEKTEMKAIRVLLFIELILAALLSLHPIEIVTIVASYIALIFLCACFPQFWISIYWRRATKAGTLVSSIVGTAIVVLWGVLFGLRGERAPIPFLGALYVALPITIVLLVVISLATKPPREEILNLVSSKEGGGQ